MDHNEVSVTAWRQGKEQQKVLRISDLHKDSVSKLERLPIEDGTSTSWLKAFLNQQARMITNQY